MNDPESRSSLVVQKAHRIATRTEFASILVFFAGLMGCIVVSARLHEPVPRINDEFSYLLMSDTLASERVSNDPPPLSEFFDTFHVLIRPSYASKYFPAQGVILAVGQKLTGRPAAGLWLGSALACGTMLLIVTFMCVIPVGLIWARIEHVSLKKISEQSEQFSQEGAEHTPAISEA